MNRTQKQEAVTELNETFVNSGSVVVCHYKGLSVAEMGDLRSKLREEGANFKVTKNTLTRLAVKDTDYEGLTDLFEGQTGIAYAPNAVSAAKVAHSYAKDNDKLVILGGAMGDTILDVAGVEQLAKMPSLDELRSTIVTLVMSPARNLAGALNATGGKVAGAIKAVADKAE